MDFQTAVATCLQKYATFDGRARRSEYWYFVLATSIVSIILQLLGNMTGSSLFLILGSVWSLAVLLPSLAALCRRLHDVGRSGWWWLISLTVIGIIPLIYWTVQPGETGANQYGPPTL